MDLNLTRNEFLNEDDPKSREAEIMDKLDGMAFCRSRINVALEALTRYGIGELEEARGYLADAQELADAAIEKVRRS